MATVSPSMDVEEEVQCPICMEDLIDPVSVECGHNFCRGCISRYCETWEELGDLECPLCKARITKGNLRPNWLAANIVDKIKYLSLKLGKEDLCARHKEKLNLFCKEDNELLCLICERSPEHQSHTVLHLEEAAEEYKGQFCSCMEVLRKEQERILADKAGAAKESRDLLSQVEAEKIRATDLFHHLHQFLEEQKTLFLGQMEELEKEVATRREEHMARLMEELSSLKGLIQQMEEQCQQPARELLQDAGGTWQRCKMRETLMYPVAFPPALKWTSLEICDKNLFLESVIKQFKGSLASGPQLQKAEVILDPDTAHPELIVSVDCKSVRWGYEYQDLPDNPERFDHWDFVLGREGFTSGRHFWEVVVGSEGEWAVGVARKSVRRKGVFLFSPEEGIWAVGKWGGQYKVLNPPDLILLSVSQELKRIQVVLNCNGQVAFFDADTGIRIYTYSGLSFCAEIILPFFYVFNKAHLELPP